MLKITTITHIILHTIFIGNFFILNNLYSGDPIKDIIIYLKPSLHSERYNDFFDPFSNDNKYIIKTINSSDTTRQSLSETIDTVKNTNSLLSKVFLCAPYNNTQVLHLAAQIVQKLNGIILPDIQYDPNYPLLDISNKFPQDLPIIICETPDVYNNSRLIYEWLREEKQRTIQYTNQCGTSSLNYYQDFNLSEKIKLENLYLSVADIRGATNYSITEQPLRDQSVKSELDTLKATEEKTHRNRYLLKTLGMATGATFLCLYVLYKIGAFYMIFGSK